MQIYTTPAISIALILGALIYFISHPYIKEGSQYTKNIVAIAIGVMLTILSIHLLPEVFDSEGNVSINSFVFLFSLITFYIIGWVSHGHEHDDEHESHTKHAGHDESGYGIMFLGQSIHSVADGVVIASSFAVSTLLGIITCIAISIHHMPMMSGVVIRHTSKNNYKRLFYMTIVSSSFMFLGLIIFNLMHLTDVSSALIAVSAASFLYVGAYDLTSYLREYDDKKIFKRIFFLFAGVLIGLLSQAMHIESELLSTGNSNTVTELDRDIDVKVLDTASTTMLHATVEYPKNNIEVKTWMQGIFLDFASSSARVMDDYDTHPYEWDATYKIATSTEFRSYIYEIYNYTGGAHGGMNVMPYVIDVKSNTRITNLTDIYNEDIYTYLENYSRSDIRRQMTANGAGDMIDDRWLVEGTAATSSNYSVFWFEGDDLIVHFGQYQVAPYAAGMYEVRVPLKEIEKYKK